MGADGGRFPSLVLLLAPIAPLLPVAAAWSRGLDPAYELVAASARAGLDLLLRRTVAVLAVVIPVLGGARGGWWARRRPGGCCHAWRSRSGALSLGEVVGLHRAATGLALVWAVVVVWPSLVTGQPSALLAAASVPPGPR